VQFDPSRLKNLRRDKALIAAAGPVSNMVLGTILVFIIKAIILYYGNTGSNFNSFLGSLFGVLYIAAQINFGLFIFNLLPIPPLDGSHIVFSGLNLNRETEDKIRKIGMPLLILVLLIQNFLNITIIPIGKMIEAIIRFLFSI